MDIDLTPFDTDALAKLCGYDPDELVIVMDELREMRENIDRALDELGDLLYDLERMYD